jgi:hypothetical protein
MDDWELKGGCRWREAKPVQSTPEIGFQLLSLTLTAQVRQFCASRDAPRDGVARARFFLPRDATLKKHLPSR